jgi:hypothetical protein
VNGETDPRLGWRELSDSTHIGSDDGLVVAILYTVDAGDSLEFCCLLTNTPEQDADVLFGVAEGTGSAWDSRWERGRRACEFVYREHLHSA